MEVWKPPNYRPSYLRKGKELQAQVLLITLTEGGVVVIITSGIPGTFAALLSITGTAPQMRSPHAAAFLLSPYKKMKWTFLKLETKNQKPNYHVPR